MYSTKLLWYLTSFTASFHGITSVDSSVFVESKIYDIGTTILLVQTAKLNHMCINTDWKKPLLWSKRSPNLDKPIQLNGIILHRKFQPVQFLDKLKALCLGPFKLIINPRDDMYELLIQNGNTSHTHQKQPMPYYAKDPLLLPQIPSCVKENHITNHDSETSVTIQKKINLRHIKLLN